MDQRDYVTEMRQVIDKEASGEYVSGLVAAEIVGKLSANDPDLLNGWLHVQAVSLVREAINHRDRSDRMKARSDRPRSVFAAAAERHEQGDPAPMHNLLDTVYVVNGDDLRKPMANMNAGDLQYVAGRYSERAQAASMESAFFAALARKVGNGTVGDYFTEEQIRDMRKSLHS